MIDAFELFAEIIETNPEVEVAYQKLKKREEKRLIAYDKGYREGCNVIPIRGKRRDTIDVEEAPCNHINFEELCKTEDIISEEPCNHEWKLFLVGSLCTWFECNVCGELKYKNDKE